MNSENLIPTPRKLPSLSQGKFIKTLEQDALLDRQIIGGSHLRKANHHLHEIRKTMSGP